MSYTCAFWIAQGALQGVCKRDVQVAQVFAAFAERALFPIRVNRHTLDNATSNVEILPIDRCT